MCSYIILQATVNPTSQIISISEGTSKGVFPAGGAPAAGAAPAARRVRGRGGGAGAGAAARRRAAAAAARRRRLAVPARLLPR